MSQEFEAAPEPEEAGSRNTALIIIAVVAIVLLCCCCLTLLLAWNYGDAVLDAIESILEVRRLLSSA